MATKHYVNTCLVAPSFIQNVAALAQKHDLHVHVNSMRESSRPHYYAEYHFTVEGELPQVLAFHQHYLQLRHNAHKRTWWQKLLRCIKRLVPAK